MSRATVRRHPLGQLILPSEVDPRVLARQQELDAHIEDADHLQGRDGGSSTEVLEEVVLQQPAQACAPLDGGPNPPVIWGDCEPGFLQGGHTVEVELGLLGTVKLLRIVASYGKPEWCPLLLSTHVQRHQGV